MKKTPIKKQAMIEFVLVLGLFFFFIGFMISGFQIMHNKMVINMAAYEATRGAIAINPTTGATDASAGLSNANSVLSHAIGFANSSVNSNDSGDYVTYTVSGTVNFLFPIINPSGIGVKRSLDIETEFTMRKERK